MIGQIRFGALTAEQDREHMSDGVRVHRTQAWASRVKERPLHRPIAKLCHLPRHAAAAGRQLRPVSSRLAVSLAVSALAMSAPARPAGALTVEAYLAMASRGQASGSLNHYFDGLRDGIAGYNAAMLSAGVRVFCPPSGEGLLEPADLRARIDAWLRERRITNPAFADYAKATPIGLVALEILNDLYACKD